MRLLFDARSVRTPAGRYVLDGLVRGWLADSRVEEVGVALPVHLPDDAIPAEARAIRLAAGDWVSHLARDLPRIAFEMAADIVFSPNATAPRHPRSVLYFQDLHHFQFLRSGVRATRIIVRETLRSTWRHTLASPPLLGIAVSSHIAAAATRRYGAPVVIPNGVDVAFGWTGEDDAVVVMGGRGRRKSEEVAVRAWSLVPASVRGATALELLGVEPEARRGALVALASSLGLDGSVRVHGSVPREILLERIARARIAVSCSRLESFGLPVAEALALGAPVVCSDIPAHMELLERAGAGRAAPAGDAAALAAALGDALSGSLPPRLAAPPEGWSWKARAREQVDAYRVALDGRAPLTEATPSLPPVVDTHVRH